RDWSSDVCSSDLLNGCPTHATWELRQAKGHGVFAQGISNWEDSGTDMVGLTGDDIPRLIVDWGGSDRFSDAALFERCEHGLFVLSCCSIHLIICVAIFLRKIIEQVAMITHVLQPALMKFPNFVGRLAQFVDPLLL